MVKNICYQTNNDFSVCDKEFRIPPRLTLAFQGKIVMRTFFEKKKNRSQMENVFIYVCMYIQDWVQC